MKLVPSIAIGILICLSLSADSIFAMEKRKTCSGVDVKSIDISNILGETAFKSAKLVDITITSVVTANSISVGKRVEIIGPLLGSMDSNKIETTMTCEPQGLTLTAYVTRSANYNGSVLKNVPWRPKISLEVYLKQPKVLFKSVWRLRLDNGVEIGRSNLPPYADYVVTPAKEYPIVITKSLTAH